MRCVSKSIFEHVPQTNIVVRHVCSSRAERRTEQSRAERDSRAEQSMCALEQERVTGTPEDNAPNTKRGTVLEI